MEHRKAKAQFHKTMSAAHKAASSCFRRCMKAMDNDSLNDLCSIHEQMGEAHDLMYQHYAKEDGEMAAAAETFDLEKLFSTPAPAASLHIPEQPQTFDSGEMFGQ